MSIENDIYQYLIKDATLLSLIGGSSADPKIYPSGLARSVSPHITYRVHGEGSSDEITDGIRLTFEITAPEYNYELVAKVRDRLNQLLDFKQAQANLLIDSVDYYIYDCEKGGGGDSRDDVARETIKMVEYDIKYLKKSV